MPSSESNEVILRVVDSSGADLEASECTLDILMGNATFSDINPTLYQEILQDLESVERFPPEIKT